MGAKMREYANVNLCYRFTGQEYDEEVGLHNFRARMYDNYLGKFYSIDPAVQGHSPYPYCGGNPVIYVDKDGKLAWFIPIIIGAVVGGTTGAIIAENKGVDWWKGAITGAFIGAGVGALGASTFGASGITVGGKATAAWSYTYSVLIGANANMAFAFAGGAKGEDMWKYGLVGAATSAASTIGGFEAAKALKDANKFWQVSARLGIQMASTSLNSIGNNWAAGKDPLGSFAVGIGPVNVRVGKDHCGPSLNLSDNISNAIFNGIGIFSTLHSWLKPGETASFPKWNWYALSFNYQNSALDDLMSEWGADAMGPFTLWGADDWNINEEVFHVWQSRWLNNLFYPIYYGSYLLNGYDNNVLELQAKVFR